MPSFYFDDVLRTVNGHLDADLWCPPPKWTLWEISAKCKPRSNFEISHNQKWQNEWKGIGKDEKEAKSEKMTTNFKWSNNNVKYGFGLISDAMKMSAEGNLYNNGWKVDGKGEYEWKFAKSEWKGKGVCNAVSPVMAEKMRLWANAELEHNQASEWKSLVKMNVSYDQYHVGVAAQNEQGDWSKQFVHVVKNDKDRQYFGRADLKNSTVGIGCSIDHESYSHSYEGTADLGADAKPGVAGTPVTIVGGGEYELSKKHSVNYTFTLGNTFQFNQTIEHNVDDKWTVAVNQAFDTECLEKDRKKPAYDFGVGVTYKL